MTTNSAVMARRKTLFGRTLILTALFVVAAASSVLCVRSARADAPVAPTKEDVPMEAQAIASVLAAQSVGNPTLGAAFMQVLWGGGIKDEPPKTGITLPPSDGVQAEHNKVQSRPAPRREHAKRHL